MWGSAESAPCHKSPAKVTLTHSSLNVPTLGLLLWAVITLTERLGSFYITSLANCWSVCCVDYLIVTGAITLSVIRGS